MITSEDLIFAKEYIESRFRTNLDGWPTVNKRRNQYAQEQFVQLKTAAYPQQKGDE